VLVSNVATSGAELLELPPIPPEAIEVTGGFRTVTVTAEVTDILEEEKL